jgi:hypothetical protein
MTTDFYSLLVSERLPHIILAHIHRRQNEIDCVMHQREGYGSLSVTEILDLTICTSFAARISNRIGRDDIDVYCAALNCIGARGQRTIYEDLGRVLASRVIGVDHLETYRDMVRASEVALQAAWEGTSEAA